MVHIIWKDFGETMSEVLDRCKKRDNITEPATYAGRLDPAAQGYVTILSGADRLRKDEFLSHDKHYTADMLLSIATDTFDIFGLITETQLESIPQSLEEYQEIASSYKGVITQQFPAFSGYRHQGKPLWQHAVEEVPTDIQRQRTIYNIAATNLSTIKLSDIVTQVDALCQRPSLQKFRVANIRSCWSTLLASEGDRTLYVVSLELHVSSGTFVRTIINTLSRSCDIPGCAFNITRTRPTTED